MDTEPAPAAPAKRPLRLWLLGGVAMAAAALAYFLLRSSTLVPATSAPEAKPAAEALVPGSTTILSGKAAILADRYNCLCGECSDTLGKCVCARDKGSNEMKATLNRLVVEKKTLAEIDAAMSEKYGPKVLVPGVSSAPPPPASQ
jgi:hypothetical protein